MKLTAEREGEIGREREKERERERERVECKKFYQLDIRGWNMCWERLVMWNHAEVEWAPLAYY